MPGSAHCCPILVSLQDKATPLKRAHLGEATDLPATRERRESFLQDLVYRCPEAIPMREIEPGLTPMMPICTELPIGGTSLDNLWMTPDGGIILGECKLVRNPQARREVLVQALDYASTMAGWSYEDLECAVGRRTGGAKLWELVKPPGYDSPDAEAEFVDAVQRRLRDGQFMVLLIIDGVQDGLETLNAYLQQHAGLHVNVAIVELSLWSGVGNELLVVPRVPLKTQLVERGIVVNGIGSAVRIIEPRAAGRETIPEPFTASEAEFYDRLEQNVPGIKDRLKAFLADLSEKGIEPEFQRSVILRWARSSEQQGSMGYVDAYGVAWLGDAYYSAKKFGNEAAGRAYVEAVAKAIGGRVQWPTADNSQLAVRGKSGRIVRIWELLDHATEWKVAIGKLAAAIPAEEFGGQSSAEMKRYPLDDRQCLEVLASFVARFREPGANFGTMGPAKGTGAPGDPIQMPAFHSTDLGNDFLMAMYRWGWVSTEFDYTEWMNSPEGETLKSSPEAIRTATADQLLKLMTVLVRRDRWMEGALADSFEQGLLLAAAERAETLLTNGESVSGALKHYPMP